jgi:hypothetical protein
MRSPLSVARLTGEASRFSFHSVGEPWSAGVATSVNKECHRQQTKGRRDTPPLVFDIWP